MLCVKGKYVIPTFPLKSPGRKSIGRILSVSLYSFTLCLAKEGVT